MAISNRFDFTSLSIQRSKRGAPITGVADMPFQRFKALKVPR